MADPPPSSSPLTQPTGHTAAAEAEDVCRVCRCEATEDQPLFHPCRCSGSIKYVHEQCLKEWLARSRKRHCELCKHTFSFTRVYREGRPAKPSVFLLVRYFGGRCFGWTVTVLRVMLVGTMWLLVVPYLTVWALRLLLWIGEDIALALSGAHLPIHVLTAREQEQNARQANRIYHGPGSIWRALFDLAIFAFDRLGSGINDAATFSSESLNGTLSTNATLHSELFEKRQSQAVTQFLADCFEGQIIAGLVVVAFISGLLLREWILQNIPPLGLQPMVAEEDGEGEGPRQNVDLPDIPAGHPPAPMPDIVRAPLPPPPQDPPRLPLVVALDAERDDDDNDEPVDLHKNDASFSTIENLDSTHSTRSLSHNCRYRYRHPISRCYRRALVRPRSRQMAFRWPLSTNPRLPSSGIVLPKRPGQHVMQVMHSWRLDSNGQRVEPRARLSIWGSPSADQKTYKLCRITMEESSRRVKQAWPFCSTTLHSGLWSARVQWGVARKSPHRRYYQRYGKALCRSPTHTAYSIVHRRRGWSISLIPREGDPILQNAHATHDALTAKPTIEGLLEQDVDWDEPDVFSTSTTAHGVQNPTLTPPIQGATADDIAAHTHRVADPAEDVVLDAQRDQRREVRPMMGEHAHGLEAEDDADAVNAPAEAHQELPQPEQPVPEDEQPPAVAAAEGVLIAGFFRQMQAWVVERLDDDDNDHDDNGDVAVNQAAAVAAEVNGIVDNVGAEAIGAAAAPEGNDVNGPIEEIAQPAPDGNVMNNGIVNDDMEAQLNDLANEDFDGVLEAMGIRGPVVILLQNAVVISVLIILVLIGAVWVPYIVGKACVLMGPVDYVMLPLRALRLITDPLVDFVIDFWLPLFWRLTLIVLGPLIWVGRLVGTLGQHAFTQVFSYIATSVSANMAGVLGQFSDTPVMHHLYWLLEQADPLWHSAYQQCSAWLNLLSELLFVAPLVPQASSSVGGVGQAILGANATAMASMPLGATTNATLAMVGWLLGDPKHDTIVRLQERWQTFAYGNTPADNFLCVAIGYMVLGVAMIVYLGYTRNAYGHVMGNVMQQALMVAALIIKVIFFVIVELIVFPTMCGILLDIASLPMFAGATIFTRIEYQLDAPFTSVFLHWFVGTGFMFFFSNFIITCRKIVRPGVMWFIRDPNDPQFHPMREILERTAWTQLRKVGSSALMYAAIIAIGFGGTIHALDRFSSGILPIRWAISQPLSSFPIDLLVLHLAVPMVITWMQPKRRFCAYFETWWRICARLLRLTSFMFGERHPDEERLLPADDDIEEPHLDGQLVLAPSHDRVPVQPRRRMLIPVDANRQPLDPADRRWMPSDDVPQDQRGIVVYLPPHFYTRIAMFIALLCACGMVAGIAYTVGPLLLGRYLCQYWLPRALGHDIYVYSIGLFTLCGLSALFELTAWSVQTIKRLRQRPLRQLFNTLVRYTRQVLQVTVLGGTFALVIPYMLGLTVRRVLVLPFLPIESTHLLVHSLMQDWALGLLYVKIICHFVLLVPNNAAHRLVHQALAGDVGQWTMRDAIMKVALPIIAVLSGLLLIPILSARGAIFLCSFIYPRDAAAEQVLHQLAPLILLAVLGVFFALRWMRQLVLRWINQALDEEFLLGERLHNYGIPMNANAAVPVEPVG